MEKIENEILISELDSSKSRWRQKQAVLQIKIDEYNSRISKLLYEDNIKKQSIENDFDVNYAIQNWDKLDMLEQKKIAKKVIDFISIGNTFEDGVRVYFK